jgi:hypothetical protein
VYVESFRDGYQAPRELLTRARDADVLGVHGGDERVDGGDVVQQHPPALVVGDVHARLDEPAAGAAPDQFLLNELQGLVGLAGQAVGSEDESRLDRLAGQRLLEAAEVGPALLGAADGQVEVDVLARDEDALLGGGLEEAADLVGDGVLVAAGVAGEDRADGPGLVARQHGVKPSDDGVDLPVGVVKELLPLGVNFGAAAGPRRRQADGRCTRTPGGKALGSGGQRPEQRGGSSNR